MRIKADCILCLLTCRPQAPTLQELNNKFDDLKKQIRRNTFVREGAGLWDRFVSLVATSLMFELEPSKDGNSPSDIVARAEKHLKVSQSIMLSAFVQSNNVESIVFILSSRNSLSSFPGRVAS